ncbi:V-type ATP synthase subunit E [Ruminococcaceae bacterium OttesenSCG-928-A11]|nr:V-type ATP synthase subunit E [Ruminococcaceae bacterium OttesenSCG-928-A11]
MTGLDKIIGEIRGEAEAEAKKTVADAQAEAEGILNEAKAASDAKAAKIAAQAAADVKDIERSRESAIALQRRQRSLAQKQALLAETLQKAQDSLYDLPEAAYFDLLVKLAAKAAQPAEGEMLLSEKDAARLPKDFEDKLKAALPAGASLSISKQTRPLDGGFVLKYGDVEENGSFAAVFAARYDEFSDLVRGTLFGE